LKKSRTGKPEAFRKAAEPQSRNFRENRAVSLTFETLSATVDLFKHGLYTQFRRSGMYESNQLRFVVFDCRLYFTPVVGGMKEALNRGKWYFSTFEAKPLKGKN
jgi:hypothetical protein